MLSDIKKPFYKVCIHGQLSSIYLPGLYENMKKKSMSEQLEVTVVNYLSTPVTETIESN
jgi:hypothetical protein